MKPVSLGFQNYILAEPGDLPSDQLVSSSLCAENFLALLANGGRRLPFLGSNAPGKLRMRLISEQAAVRLRVT